MTCSAWALFITGLGLVDLTIAGVLLLAAGFVAGWLVAIVMTQRHRIRALPDAL